MNRVLNWLKHQLPITAACCIFYFVLSIPFIEFFQLSETTEVRPYCVLPFIFSLLFGFSGALGTAIGNIFSDMYYGGMDYRIYTLGFSFQIIYGYGGSLLWKYLRRRDSNIFRLDKFAKIAQYLMIILLMSVVLTVMVWTLLNVAYNLPLFGMGFMSTLLNHLIFFVILGIPFFVGYSYYLEKKKLKDNPAEGNDFHFSVNEKFILFFVLISVIIALIVSAGAYIFFSSYKLYDQTTMWSYLYLISGTTLYVCLWPTLIVLRSVENHLSRPIEELSAIGQHFGEYGDIAEEIRHIKAVADRYMDYQSEIGLLAESFRTFSDKIEESVNKLTAISQEQTRVATQLGIARDIQRGVLPEPLKVEGADLFATSWPAFQVGGDFFDYFKIGDHKLGFVIADVSGKDVPASLFMMISKVIIQKNMEDGLSPGAALTRSNNDICRNNRADMFVTVFCGVLDLENGVLEYSSAGHDHPIVSVNNENFTLLQNKTGFVLGEIEDVRYTDNALTLGKGDVIFVYTDGIPEATDKNDEQFGFDRTLAALNSTRDRDMAGMCDALMKSIEEFRGDAKQFDDITMLAIRKI